jgi:hypothetical protein
VEKPLHLHRLVFLGSDTHERQMIVVREVFFQFGKERALARAATSDNEVEVVRLRQGVVVSGLNKRLGQHRGISFGSCRPENVADSGRTDGHGG